MSERALVKAIFDTTLRGTAGNTAAHRDALWTAATTLMADVLRSHHPYTREVMLRGLEKEMRAATKHLSQCIANEEAREAESRAIRSPAELPPWEPVEDCTQWQCAVELDAPSKPAYPLLPINARYERPTAINSPYPVPR
jgi:hypothetical protein